MLSNDYTSKDRFSLMIEDIDPPSSAAVPTESGNIEGGFQLFTVNSAFEQIGGFGRFQLFACIVFAILRNVGSLFLITFGLNP